MKKLFLNRETIRHLSLSGVRGAGANTTTFGGTVNTKSGEAGPQCASQPPNCDATVVGPNCQSNYGCGGGGGGGDTGADCYLY
jgi:hypothetical protein